MNLFVQAHNAWAVLPRQGPRFSIRMIIWIFCSDTETGAVTPLGRGAETLTALKI